MQCTWTCANYFVKQFSTTISQPTKALKNLTSLIIEQIQKNLLTLTFRAGPLTTERLLCGADVYNISRMSLSGHVSRSLPRFHRQSSRVVLNRLGSPRYNACCTAFWPSTSIASTAATTTLSSAHTSYITSDTNANHAKQCETLRRGTSGLEESHAGKIAGDSEFVEILIDKIMNAQSSMAFAYMCNIEWSAKNWPMSLTL